MTAPTVDPGAFLAAYVAEYGPLPSGYEFAVAARLRDPAGARQTWIVARGDGLPPLCIGIGHGDAMPSPLVPYDEIVLARPS